MDEEGNNIGKSEELFLIKICTFLVFSAIQVFGVTNVMLLPAFDGP